MESVDVEVHSITFLQKNKQKKHKHTPGMVIYKTFFLEKKKKNTTNNIAYQLTHVRTLEPYRKK